MRSVDELIGAFARTPEEDATETADIAAIRAALGQEIAGERGRHIEHGRAGRIWRRRSGVRPEQRSIGGVVILAMAAVVTVGVAAVFLIALGAGRHAAPVSGLNGPVGSPVSAGFEAQSVTAISFRRWWLIGQRPCSHEECLAIVRTSDGGRTFVSIPAPPLRYKTARCTAQLQFADQRNGFVVYGCAMGTSLYVTHDGGGHWHKLDLGGYVSRLATGGGEAYAAIIRDPRNPITGELMRSPVGEDDWKTISPSGIPNGPPGKFGLAARGNDLFALSENTLLISHDRGASFSRSTLGYGLGCTIQPVAARVVWAFCLGPRDGAVLRSTDGGHSFVNANRGPYAPSRAVFAAADANTALVGYQQLMLTADAGRSYTPVGPVADGGWADLVFTDPRHGVGLVFATGSGTSSRLYATDDGGHTFHGVPIGAGAPTRPAPDCRSPQLRMTDSAEGVNTGAIVFAEIRDTGAPCILAGKVTFAVYQAGKLANVRGNPARVTLASKTIEKVQPEFPKWPNFYWLNWCGTSHQIHGTLTYRRIVLQIRFPVLPVCINSKRPSSIQPQIF
jgi:photosystem II stability/assembly factor-like uncharacterized protein